MSQFSYKTMAIIIDALERTSFIKIRHFLERCGVPEEISSRSCDSKLYLLREAVHELFSRGQQDVLKEMVETALGASYLSSDEPSDERLRLEEALLSDGFILESGKIREETAISVQEEKGALEALIERNQELNKSILLQHLKDNLDLYQEGKWHPSIGEARSFVEQLLWDIAHCLAKRRSETPELERPVKVRDYLQKCGFFDDDERKRLVDGVYGYLSEEGSHPGLSEQSTARLTMIVLLSFGFYVIEKFEVIKASR